ncbi:uncharacterized protein LOC142334140 [Lycorma delicatula]|uniref:uncharacterized protein LOC142334140 n=1 Tax=Lycorma delicatula TaxID=130591 RepID=UPI003F5169F4
MCLKCLTAILNPPFYTVNEMNTIYSYKYLWLIEFLIFISLCNDIYASSLTQLLSLKKKTEDVKNNNDIIFQRTCEKFGFSQNQIGLYNRCIEMVWSLEPNLNPSDMEAVANNVKSWKISLVDARELLNMLIEYKWGVTEYGLFLQHLDKNPDRMNCVKNVMEAMPWKEWKLFCDEKFVKRFETYENMPFIVTPKEYLEELTHYMKVMHIYVKNWLTSIDFQITQRKNPTQVQEFGCPYPFVSAVIDLYKKGEGKYSIYEIDDLYHALCFDGYYYKWDINGFRKLCNEVVNSNIIIYDLKRILEFGSKVVEAIYHFDDSERLQIIYYNMYLKFCDDSDCRKDLSEFLVNIFVNSCLDGETLLDIDHQCIIDNGSVSMDLLELLSTISYDIVNISKNQRKCYKNLVLKLYKMYITDTTINYSKEKILKLKNITALIKNNKWNICDYNYHLDEVVKLKMNIEDYIGFIKANSNETELNKMTDILVYISKLEIENIWTILGKMKLKSNYKFVEILQWKDSEIAIQSIKYYFSLDKPMDCYTDILKGIILYNIRIGGNLNKDQHERIYKLLCPNKDVEKLNLIVESINSDELLAKNPEEYISELKNKYSRKLALF